MKWIFCAIDDSRLKREAFDCGIPELNEYLKKYARQNDRRGIAKTFAVIVDSKNQQAKEFYLKYGFIPLEDDELSLFIPIATIIKVLE
ncbi:hypothetical protein [Microcoleus sp. herbarium12]|jgi:hypothetical protein|uniref:hypothetical protein n=1 Tax=Microcoleus sp. herbarium12 TaxID=3055437 RepID=UPI002FD44CD3